MKEKLPREKLFKENNKINLLGNLFSNSKR